MKQNADAFGAALIGQLRAARKARGWTQSELAARTEGQISKAALAGYEVGHRTLRIPVAWTLARALDENLSALIRRAEHMSNTSDPPPTLKVRQILNSSDENIAAVRTWLGARYPSDVDDATRVPLTDDAVEALSTLMQITEPECRGLIQPYIEQEPAER